LARAAFLPQEENGMKRMFTACLFALALLATTAAAEQMTGVITCSKCRHTEADKADCAKSCIKSGVPAIFVGSDSKVYKIANPDKIGDNVNQKVTVEGSLEGDTLTLESVKPAAES
jgi:hypothetical protein